MSSWRVKEKRNQQLADKLAQLINERIDKFADKLYELNTVLNQVDDNERTIDYNQMILELTRTLHSSEAQRRNKFAKSAKMLIDDIMEMLKYGLTRRTIINKPQPEQFNANIQTTKNYITLNVNKFIKNNEHTNQDVLHFSIQQILDKLDDALIKFNKHANRFIGLINTILHSDINISKFKKFYHPEGGPFGHFVWPKKRMGIHLKIENDTKLEAETFYAFSEYITRNNSSELTPKIIKTVRQFLADDMYTDVFTKPNASKIYRGMSLNSKADVSQYDLINILNSTSSFIYRPRSVTGISSWTSSYEIAKDFTNKIFSDKATIRVILSTSTIDLNMQSKLLDLKKIYNFSMDSNHRNEREIIAFGEIPITEWEILE